jgi:hypothetical protein
MDLNDNNFYLVMINFLNVSYLYLGKDILSESIREKIENALIVFPFWPHTDNTNVRNCGMRFKIDCVHDDEITFWSENHALMLLSSAHLFRQYIYTYRPAILERKPTPTCLITELETVLLMQYLKVHASFEGGVYEVMSHVYLPYTISALLNLIDFSEVSEIENQALGIDNIPVEIGEDQIPLPRSKDNVQSEFMNLVSIVLTNIIKHVLVCTSDTGVVAYKYIYIYISYLLIYMHTYIYIYVYKHIYICIYI